MQDRKVSIPGVPKPVVETSYEDGIKSIRFDEHDLVWVDCVLIDALNRKRNIQLKSSTVLVMVPTGELGALLFDPTGQRDEHGLPIFMQRNVLCEMDVRRLMGDKPRVAIVGGR